MKEVVPEYPDNARRLHVGDVTVLAEVTVKPDGTPSDITIYKSSGNMQIDREAIRVARDSTYKPKLMNCTPVTGQFLFRAQFSPDPPTPRFPVPQFSAPAGWSPNQNPSPASGFDEFGEWSRNGSVIGVMATTTAAPLREYVMQRIDFLKASRARIVSSDSISLCNGATGWKLSYRQGTTSYVEVLQVFDDRLYESYYYSSDVPADAAVMTSLLSLCGS